MKRPTTSSLVVILAVLLSSLALAQTLEEPSGVIISSAKDFERSQPRLATEPPEDLEHAPGKPVKTFILPATNPTPTNYRLYFQPNFRKFTFTGVADIAMRTNDREDTKRILLNSVGLDISKVGLYTTAEDAAAGSNLIGGEPIVRYNTSFDIVAFNFPNYKELKRGEIYYLHLEWSGKISSGMDGWYRSAYKNGDTVGYIFTTQFQPASARKVFPCVDEPYFKTTFSISMKAPADYEAVSNGPVMDTKVVDGGKNKVVNFETTTFMSTYLVALVVGPFTKQSMLIKSCSVKLNSLVPLGASGSPDFALSVANKSLDYFQWYFQQRYVMHKLDLIAIPDFSFGAMENWGAITFRESLMLIDSEKSSEHQKQRVAYVVAHELAHQWFGNLVTMQWWNELWLNEGFATWAGNYFLSQFYPQWNVWTDFVSSYTFSAFELDALASSHPVSMNVKKASEASDIFDKISYDKGAALIQMLSNHIGMVKFRESLRHYMNEHKYKSVTVINLLQSIESKAPQDVPIKEVMLDWIYRPGFPIIKASLHDDGVTIKLNQTRYLPLGSKAKIAREEDGKEVHWVVPISLAYKVKGSNALVEDSILLESTVGTYKLPENWEFVKLNRKQVGYYRVHYDSALQQRLQSVDSLFSLADPVDRLGLINDAFARFYAGLMPADELLFYMRFIRAETDRVVIESFIRDCDKVEFALAANDEAAAKKWAEYVKHLLEPLHELIGFDGVSQVMSESAADMLRSSLYVRLAVSGHQASIEKAKSLFARGLANGASQGAAFSADHIKSDLRGFVYKTVVREGVPEAVDTMKRIALDTSVLPEERIRAIDALGYSKEENTLKNVLEWALVNVKAQDLQYIFASVGENAMGTQLNWDFVSSHFVEIVKRFGDDGITSFGVKNIIRSSFENFAAAPILEQVSGFYKTKPVSSHSLTIVQAIETVELRAAFVLQLAGPLGTALENLKI